MCSHQLIWLEYEDGRLYCDFEDGDRCAASLPFPRERLMLGKLPLDELAAGLQRRSPGKKLLLSSRGLRDEEFERIYVWLSEWFEDKGVQLACTAPHRVEIAQENLRLIERMSVIDQGRSNVGFVIESDSFVGPKRKQLAEILRNLEEGLCPVALSDHETPRDPEIIFVIGDHTRELNQRLRARAECGEFVGKHVFLLTCRPQNESAISLADAILISSGALHCQPFYWLFDVRAFPVLAGQLLAVVDYAREHNMRMNGDQAFELALRLCADLADWAKAKAERELRAKLDRFSPP